MGQTWPDNDPTDKPPTGRDFAAAFLFVGALVGCAIWLGVFWAVSR